MAHLVNNIFDPTTAHGLIAIAVAGGLIVALILFLVKLISSKNTKMTHTGTGQTTTGDGNIQIQGNSNRVSGGSRNGTPKQ